jgi:peptidoglycan/LPS O-acetylase OafA/YrhL
MTYLPHIDGLRAIAILLVVAYHSGFSIFSGGFIGVDVFFVISGFLITSQISKLIAAEKFSFKEFYLRRLRRLAPAYLIVSATSLIVGLVILLPSDLIYHTKVMGLSFLSLSNIYLSNTTNGYFDNQSEEIPFLHTWSLAVEEQFYILWPILLLLSFRIFNKSFNKTFLLCLFFCSLALSYWLSKEDPDGSYYMLLPRFYELLLGSILAISLPKLPTLSPPANTIIALLGAGLIFGAGFYFNEKSTFPGLLATIPCLGAALLIFSGMRGYGISNFLTCRPMLITGKISYSLYLWHWPIFAFIRYATGDLTTTQACLAIAASFFLSYFTWKFIEQPTRHKSFKKPFIYLYAIPLSIFIFTFIIIDKNDGLISRFGDDNSAVNAFESKPKKLSPDCHLNSAAGVCGDILLAGDSHARHFSDFIDVLASAKGLNTTLSTLLGCPPLIGVTPIDLKNKYIGRFDECKQHNDEVYRIAGHYKYMVISGFWSDSEMRNDYFLVDEHSTSQSKENNLKVVKRSLINSINRIISLGVKPVIIKDNPSLSNQVFLCSRRNILPYFDKVCVEKRTEIDKQQYEIKAFFEELSTRYPELIFIDPIDIMCNEQHCLSAINDIPLYLDKQHLNGTGSRVIGEEYLIKNGSPFEK